MKSVFVGLGALAVLVFTGYAVSAEAGGSESERPGFRYGGAPEFDAPPLAKSELEKQAPAALDEISRGPWHLNVTTRDRVTATACRGGGRQAKSGDRNVERLFDDLARIGSVNCSTEGKVYTHELDPEKVKIATANFRKAGVENLVEIIEGDAHETVKQHTEPIDIVFLDADRKAMSTI